jgi:uncharacterized damage-inducible protein DinB
MAASLYRIEDRGLLEMVTGISVGFHSPEAVLHGLTPEQATAKPAGAPHSIAEIVAHMCFWQHCFNQIALNGFTGFPQQAQDGWPPCPADQWPVLHSRYLAVIRESEHIARTAPDLDAKLLPDGVPIPFLERDTRGSGVLHGAIHAAHHLGQVVLLRQLMGLWPPPAGSMTW